MSVLAGLVGEGCSAQFDLQGGFLLYAALVLHAFYVLAKVCDGHLTLALEFIVTRLKISEDIAGATFLAVASSAPELFCAILSTFILVGPSGVGNIVGSAVFNLLVIIGVLPFCTQGRELKIWWYPTARDSGFYLISIVALWLSIADGVVVWKEAFAMLFIYSLYVAWMYYNARIIKYFDLKSPAEIEQQDKEAKKAADLQAQKAANNVMAASAGFDNRPTFLGPPMYPQLNNHPTATVLGDQQQASDSLSDFSTQASSVADAECGLGPRPAADSSKEPTRAGDGMLMVIQSSGNLRSFLSGAKLEEFHTCTSSEFKDVVEGEGDTDTGKERSKSCPTEPVMWVIDGITPTSEDKVFCILAIVIVVIGVFTYIMVDAGERLGCIMHIPQIVMGLIILAAGTSVPDCISSIAVARQGLGDMAAANAVGSNTFNLLVGLPFPWLLSCMMGNEVTVPVEQLTESLIILLVCLLGYVCLLHLGGWVLSKKIGGLMIVAYFVSIAFTLVREFTYYSKQVPQ